MGFIGVNSVSAQGFNASFPSNPESGIEIQVTNVFRELPPHGFAPLHLIIKNFSGQTHAWEFTFRSYSGWNTSSSELVRTVSAPPDRESHFEIMVPLANAGARSTYARMEISASGYGLPASAQTSQHNSSSSPSGSPLPFTVMSQALAINSWRPLEEAGKGARKEIAGCEVDPKRLPEDWRGWLGISTFFCTDQEWLELSPAQKAAARLWLAQGGHLIVCSPTITETRLMECGVPSDTATGSDVRYGYGRAQLWNWDGNSLPATTALKWLEQNPQSTEDWLNDGYDKKWNLRQSLGEIGVEAGFIYIFVVLFALLVGPVNMFYLAKGSQRMRLFVTTPLISLGASIILALVIIFQDGFGGQGRRLTLWLLLPQEKSALGFQEQVSRTGLLLNNYFVMEDQGWLAPLGYDKFYAGKQPVFRTVEDRVGGDWFASRKLNAQWAHVIRPSRARVDILNAQEMRTQHLAPIVLSSLPEPLQNFYYRDPQGGYWRGEQLQPGSRSTLQPATEQEWQAWWKKVKATNGAALQHYLKAVEARQGYFYAQGSGAESVPTLPSIRWRDEPSLYVGRGEEVNP
jgi:hypothetical protein